MGMNMCLICEYCDPEKTNDLKQVRCKKFFTYVDLLNYCDYFVPKEKITLTNMITKQLRSEQK